MPSIFERPEYEQYAGAWMARTKELEKRRSYYDGSVYKKAFSGLGPLSAYLNQKTRPLYLPMHRAVDVDAGIVPGGWAWPAEGDGITQAQIDAWSKARRQIFDWSRWQTEGVLYVHYGAEAGLSVLRVSDIRDVGRIQLSPVDPAKVLLIGNGQYDTTWAVAFYVDQRVRDGNVGEYAEVITPEAIMTYWEAEPVGVDGREPEYVNELGFVPFVQAEHKKTGREYGECTYQAAIPMLDEVNAIATDLATNIKNHGDPQWVVAGAEAKNMVHSGDNIWFLPKDSSVDALVAKIDIKGALDFVAEIARNMKDSLPELAFDELKSKDQIATATVELQLMELTLKIKRVRPNYDQGLVDALRMCGMAAESIGGMADIAALNDDMLTLDSDRPVLPQDRLDQIRVEEAEIALEMQRSMNNGDGYIGDQVEA